MDRYQIIMSIVNILAVVVAPIVAVIIAQRLQAKEEKRKDQMWIFKTLMTSRVYGWTLDSVYALNIIDIVFCDDNSVRIAWKELYDKYSVSNPDKQHLLKVEQAQYRLLEEIAIVLGYKDKITWETIQNPYIPQGLVDHIKAQQLNQQMYADVLQSAKNMIPSNAGETENNAN